MIVNIDDIEIEKILIDIDPPPPPPSIRRHLDLLLIILWP